MLKEFLRLIANPSALKTYISSCPPKLCFFLFSCGFLRLRFMMRVFFIILLAALSLMAENTTNPVETSEVNAVLSETSVTTSSSEDNSEEKSNSTSSSEETSDTTSGSEDKTNTTSSTEENSDATSSSEETSGTTSSSEETSNMTTSNTSQSSPGDGKLEGFVIGRETPLMQLDDRNRPRPMNPSD
ncbi:cell wall protein IFF6-like [Ischnura elegans]|uniref:cell wall protein IFF6-like n=1 Tax=Ischnura elegans TaxID=197161 RepID=UPI001ED87FA9|nr:cell wall protein IFF6-like [Ischnura elegans]